jgi:uncharacterized protein involved in exopolysaccharide biosynthesis
VQREDELGLGALLALIARRWLLIGVIVVACTGLGVAAALLMTPVYRAEILVMPADGDDSGGTLSSLAAQFGSLASLVGDNLSGGGDREEALALLGSRALATQFISDSGLLPVFFADKWDSAAQRWVVEGDDAPTMADAYKLFNESIRGISVNSQTGLITLSIEWTDPDLAAAWANELIARVNASMRDRTIEEAERSIEFLNKEIDKTSVVDLRAAIFSLVESQVKRIMLANARDQYAFKIIDPAVPAEKDQFVRPRRMLIAASAFVAGVLLAGFMALAADVYGRWRRDNAARR